MWDARQVREETNCSSHPECVYLLHRQLAADNQAALGFNVIA